MERDAVEIANQEAAAENLFTDACGDGDGRKPEALLVRLRQQLRNIVEGAVVGGCVGSAKSFAAQALEQGHEAKDEKGCEQDAEEGAGVGGKAVTLAQRRKEYAAWAGNPKSRRSQRPLRGKDIAIKADFLRGAGDLAQERSEERRGGKECR